MGAGNSAAEGAGTVEGYRLGPAGEVFVPVDAGARMLIAELSRRAEAAEQKIAELEARAKVWQGTEAEHKVALEKGEVRVGDFVIITGTGAAGGGAGEGTDTGSTGTDGTGTDAGQEGGMPGTGQEE